MTLKMHLIRVNHGGKTLCGQYFKYPKSRRTTNVDKMEDCKKCLLIKKGYSK